MDYYSPLLMKTNYLLNNHMTINTINSYICYCINSSLTLVLSI